MIVAREEEKLVGGWVVQTCAQFILRSNPPPEKRFYKLKKNIFTLFFSSSILFKIFIIFPISVSIIGFCFLLCSDTQTHTRP
jgi:hypothetical protein